MSSFNNDLNMSEIQQDAGTNIVSVFQEDADPRNFFGGAGRRAIVNTLLQTLENGTPLMVLYGEDGSGKTMICRKIEQDSPRDILTVLFAGPVDSFEDVILTVALMLGGDIVSEQGEKSIEHVLDSIVEQLRREEKGLLLIFDEAENIFLATLERIRRMVDRVVDSGCRMHLLFSGRKVFLENYEQLALCDFNIDEERFITLPPLSSSDLAEYFLFCVNQRGVVGGDEIFTDKVLADIFNAGQGNFRLTNMLAREATEGRDDDSSFIGLLEEIKRETQGGVEDNESAFDVRKIWHSLTKNRMNLLFVGGGFVCLLVLMALFFSGQKENDFIPLEAKVEQLAWVDEPEKTVAKPELSIVRPEKSDKDNMDGPLTLNRSETGTQKVKEQAVEVKEQEQDKVIVDESGKSNRSDSMISGFTGGNVIPLDREQVVTADFSRQLKKDIAEISPLPGGESGELSVNSTESKEAEESGLHEQKRLADDAELEQTMPEPVEFSLIQPKEPVKLTRIDKKTIEPPQDSQPEEIVELHPAPSLKVRPEKLHIEPQEPVKKNEQNEVQGVISAGTHFSTEQLYRKRTMAGGSWKNGANDSKYTVQLMVLTSDNAEENLMTMLSQDIYRQEAGNFFIFKKMTSPYHVFVFYGEYSTIARARLAQNSLPPFLREHQPYAISIKGALAKVTR